MRRIPSPPPPIIDVLIRDGPDGEVCDNNNTLSSSVNKSKLPYDPRKRQDNASVPVDLATAVEEREKIVGSNVEQEEEGQIIASNIKTDKYRNVGQKREGRVPCKYWMEGKCSKGSACTFSHALPPRKTASDVRSEHAQLLSLPADDLLRLADAENKTIWEILTQSVCRFRMMAGGECSKGDDCLYSHDLQKIPCRYWHAWGRCSSGNECRFNHGRIDEAIRDRIRQEAHVAVQKERAQGRKRVREDAVQNQEDEQSQENNIQRAFEEELQRQLNPFSF
jgi:hypothetical protein